jgi:hypothetical protein
MKANSWWLKMKNTMKHFLSIILLFVATASLLSACSVFKFGEIGAVKEANELAIACKTHEALAAVDRAEQGGGLGASIGDLQRVVILRDAGRVAEANATMVERNKRWNADAKNVKEAEDAVAKSLEEMRAERQKRTGRRTCK